VQGIPVQKNTNQEYQQPNKEHAWGDQQLNHSNNKRGQMYLKKREQPRGEQQAKNNNS
jgi:hypothetical protein